MRTICLLTCAVQDDIDVQLKQFQLLKQQEQQQQRLQQQKQQKDHEVLEATIVDLLNQLSTSQV